MARPSAAPTRARRPAPERGAAVRPAPRPSAPAPSAGSEATRALYAAEPPARYVVRPSVVVDCSLLCAVLFEEPEGTQAQAMLAGKQLCAPTLLDQEVLNVAVVKQRRGLAAEATQRALADYLEHPIDFAVPALPAQLELALRYELSGYDAAYLWLAAELRAPLLTFDRKLAEAARKHFASLE